MKISYKKLNSSVFPANQGGPLMHVIAGKAVALKEIWNLSSRFTSNKWLRTRKAMVAVFLDRGCQAVSGGTDNHLFLLDLRIKHHG